MGKHSYRHPTNDELNTGAPYIDAEFTEEPDPADIRNRPEWRAWGYYGSKKQAAALQYLQFRGEKDGLYAYRDWRDDQVYTLPVLDELERFRRNQQETRKKNADTWPQWRTAWIAWGVATTIAFFYGLSLATGDYASRDANATLADVIFNVFLGLLLAGPIFLGVGRWMTKAEPIPLPDHRMFYTDEERAEIERQRQARERAKEIATAAAVADMYVRHQRHALAKDIAREMNKRD